LYPLYIARDRINVREIDLDSKAVLRRSLALTANKEFAILPFYLRYCSIPSNLIISQRIRTGVRCPVSVAHRHLFGQLYTENGATSVRHKHMFYDSIPPRVRAIMTTELCPALPSPLSSSEGAALLS
jgi:hypothetical protein